MQAGAEQQRCHEDERNAIFERIRVRIRGLAASLGCGAEAEDIAQESFVVIVEKYSDKSPEELIKLANRICTNFVFNRRRRPDRYDGPLSDYIRDACCSPEELAAKAELARALVGGMEKCRSRDKALLRLDLQGAGGDEICSELGIDRDTLYSRRNRCYALLRTILRGLW